MHVELIDATQAALERYSAITIAFEVHSVLDVSAPRQGLGGLVLTEQQITLPYVKDYDAITDSGPAEWLAVFGVATCRLAIVGEGDDWLGGAAVALSASEFVPLDEARDAAILWDIRVSPHHRRSGIGSSLITAAECWARDRGARAMQVETQNVNVPACRFYARSGYDLRAINRDAYPELPDEAQLLWYKSLR